MILSIDPGTEKCGISILSKKIKIEIEYSKQLPLIGSSLEQRLWYLFEFLDQLISSYKNSIECIALEQTFVAPMDNGKAKYNIQSPLKLSMARGIVWSLAGKYGLKVYEYHPRDVKFASTRNYNASKKMIMREISKHWKAGVNEDEADSISVGLAHYLAESQKSK